MSCSYFIDKLLFRGSDSRYFCQTVWSDLAVPRYISSLETLLFSFKQYFFFLQASFISSGNRTDISLDDPNFWQKWAKIAEVEIDSKSEKVESDWANARFLNGRKRRRASEQLRRTRVSNWMENSEAWSVREPWAWSGARGGFRQICWCFHRQKRSFSLVVHFLSACIASSHFWVVGIKFIMKNWFCFSDVDSCLLVSSSLVFFFFGVAGVFGDWHPTGEEADPSLQLFRGRWTDGVLRVGQRLGGKTVSDTSPGWTQPAVPPCRVLQSGKELAHLWVYIENFTSPSSLVSFWQNNTFALKINAVSHSPEHTSLVCTP